MDEFEKSFLRATFEKSFLRATMVLVTIRFYNSSREESFYLHPATYLKLWNELHNKYKTTSHVIYPDLHISSEEEIRKCYLNEEQKDNN